MEKEEPRKVVAADGHTYHKSATANAKTAPTNDNTIQNAVGDAKKLTEDELIFVTIVHYEWSLKGELPSTSFMKVDYGYSEEELKKFYETERVAKALQERGVELKEKHLEEAGIPFEKKEKHASKLTPLQLIVANRMLDLTDTRSDLKKLQDSGVTTARYQSWMRDPDFNGYLRERAESMIGDVQHEAMLSLVDNIRAGRLDAIKYYHALTGRYVEQKGEGGGSVGDLQAIIVRIIEIINDEVTDPDTAARIAGKLKGLVMGNQVAGVLPNPEVVVPETAEGREITPEVRKLMDKGLGYDS